MLLLVNGRSDNRSHSLPGRLQEFLFCLFYCVLLSVILFFPLTNIDTPKTSSGRCIVLVFDNKVVFVYNVLVSDTNTNWKGLYLWKIQ